MWRQSLQVSLCAGFLLSYHHITFFKLGISILQPQFHAKKDCFSSGACIKTKRLVVSTLVTIRNTILMFLNDPDPQHQFARVIKVTNFQVMAILSCLAALLLLLISSFTLMEDINSSVSSSNILQELETGSSYTPSINVHSNMTNDLSRERAVHRLRTGVYATEVK